MVSDHYYYHILSKENQSLYKCIYDACLKYEDLVTVHGNYDEKDFRIVIESLLKDNPYFFYLDFNHVEFISIGDWVDVKLHFLLPKDKCDEISEKVKRNATTILSKINISERNESEIVRSIHDLLVCNVVYDLVGLKAGAYDTDGIFAHSVLGVFLKKTAVCDGISKAFKYLLNAVGIKSIVVTGKGESEYNYNNEMLHAWNIVKIDGKNYHIDLTWDIAGTRDGLISYDYYCLTDDMITKDHTMMETMPACGSTEHNYFYKHNAFIKNEDELKKYVSETLLNDNKTIYVKLDQECDYHKAEQYISDSIMMKMYDNNEAGMVSLQNNQKQGIIKCSYTSAQK